MSPSTSNCKKALLVAVTEENPVIRNRDVRCLSTFLIAHRGFHPNSIFTMTSGDTSSPLCPTEISLMSQLSRILKELSPGGELLFYFSGHSMPPSQMHACCNAKVLRKNNTINIALTFIATLVLPGESTLRGKLQKVRDRIIKLMPSGAKATVIIDSCYSGAFFDNVFLLRDSRFLGVGISPFHGWGTDKPTIAWESEDPIDFSMTRGLVRILHGNPNCSWQELMHDLRLKCNEMTAARLKDLANACSHMGCGASWPHSEDQTPQLIYTNGLNLDSRALL
ncbi:hypothetical protein CONPUDRAFT_145502 [Coniophora puteana RWD-64-598 SS2]|uniref:Peptidase C14 n=1 Tax=Coniophora puteana (strain RWD-64-598) TaxID=741705 RepID=A0A5M3MGI4_CONPW|nr:uncharacterized protein CONPUDRAFT_145502 [Coniophora puteana RWD-64-598 SS2]EIW78167.1 hypothetical protein CONPUDRAFT_145502 [Coniophora puteana RWD-64-598 SS2]